MSMNPSYIRYIAEIPFFLHQVASLSKYIHIYILKKHWFEYYSERWFSWKICIWNCWLWDLIPAEKGTYWILLVPLLGFRFVYLDRSSLRFGLKTPGICGNLYFNLIVKIFEKGNRNPDRHRYHTHLISFRKSERSPCRMTGWNQLVYM